MYDSEGNKTWEADLDIYGKVRNFAGRSLNECPFRWQGQYEDSETGLCYNRFRYYDPDSGNYISQDPIGLAGNNPTIYGYVKDVNSWIDVFGLTNSNRDSQTGRYTNNPNPPSPKPLSTHGNFLSSEKPTWGYKLYSEDGTFLKNGITSELVPESRYTKEFMKDKYMESTLFPDRQSAYDWEYEQNRTNKGPLNKNMH